jgi:hypothetical protein
VLRQQTKEEQQRVLEGKRKAFDAQIAAMRSELAQEEARVTLVTEQEEQREQDSSREMLEMVNFRGGMRRGKMVVPNGRG